MEVASLILSIISIVMNMCLFLCLVICFTRINTPQQSQSSTNTASPQTQEDSTKSYYEGQNSIWVALHLSIFQLFKNADIFDYEGMVENITTLIGKIITDEKYAYTIMQELSEYKKRTDYDSDDNN